MKLKITDYQLAGILNRSYNSFSLHEKNEKLAREEVARLAREIAEILRLLRSL